MKPVIALVAALIVLLPSVSFAAGPAGAAEEDDAEPFYAKMEDHILTSAEAVADIVSGYAENLPLSPGTVSVFEAVVNGEYSSPQTAPVEDLVRYTGDTRIEELHISGGAGIEIEDGATVTVDRLFAESGGETISFSSAGLGCIVI
ncbi:MAG: hypothetical protein J5494_03535, partial [Candidatus Methanomethylophilaceae archaeon]|nr:hypothetical protein [Candidatus Methanomethylophilaceae archaeon]